MLFGRRKPGFAKEVDKTEEVVDYFCDANDPAMNRQADNPKQEKAEIIAAADAVMNGEAAPAEEKVNLLDYMESLPEVNDPFPASEDPMIESPEEHKAQLKDGEILAEFVRERSANGLITAKKPLMKEDENMPAMLEEMFSLESCADIKEVKGNKDEYLYSDENMANNYAMIAMLVEEKDIARTMAHMIRFNAKTYPAPTPLYYFQKTPYNYTMPQIQNALRAIRSNPDTQDIKSYTTHNNIEYLYPEGIMSFKYARALAEDAETDEAGN
ncbi:MAG: hypothetical protein Q4C54_05820 [Clostridia bacterium]|nr:hypothetical protein [Clostridia bacterium]